jgi:hypothetical protein
LFLIQEKCFNNNSLHNFVKFLHEHTRARGPRLMKPPLME